MRKEERVAGRRCEEGREGSREEMGGRRRG